MSRYGKIQNAEGIIVLDTKRTQFPYGDQLEDVVACLLYNGLMATPIPTLVELYPSFTRTGASFVATLVGTHYLDDNTVVTINGEERVTVFGGAQKLNGTVLSADVASAGSLLVRAATMFPNEVSTDPLTMTVNAGNYAGNIDRWDIGQAGHWVGYTVICLKNEKQGTGGAEASGTLSKVWVSCVESGTLKLKIFRDDGTNYNLVWEDSVRSVVVGLNEITLSRPIQAGDFLGAYVVSSDTLDNTIMTSGYHGSASFVKYNHSDVTTNTLKSAWTASSERLALGGKIT